MPAAPRIQLVDSDPRTAIEMASTLRRRGWEVVSSSDATSAIAVAVQSRPDAVVLNMDVPGGGGLAVLRRLRQSIHTAITPVVALARDPVRQERDVLAAGGQECIGAGANADAVCAALERHIARPPTVGGAPVEVLHDATRMAALRASGLLDSPAEAAYDDVTRLAARLLGVPVALLSLVDLDRQFFKSQVGLGDPWASRRETPMSHSFCQWVVSSRDVVRIDDARALPTLRTNPAIEELGVVAYAGVPVFGAERQALGSFCAIDSQPRAWSDRDVATLQDLASIAEVFAARAELERAPPARMADFDRHVDAAGNAVDGAVNLLERCAGELGPADAALLHRVVRQNARHLVQLNRLIQVADLFE